MQRVPYCLSCLSCAAKGICDSCPSQRTRRTGHPQLWWLLQFEGRATRLAISGLGILALTTASTAATALAGTALMGYGLGSEADVVPYLIARYFGRKHFAALYGLTWTAYAVGGATGPIVVGHFYDRAGMYQPRMVAALALTCAVGAALSFLLPRYPIEPSVDAKDLPASTRLVTET